MQAGITLACGNRNDLTADDLRDPHGLPVRLDGQAGARVSPIGGRHMFREAGWLVIRRDNAPSLIPIGQREFSTGQRVFNQPRRLAAGPSPESVVEDAKRNFIKLLDVLH